MKKSDKKIDNALREGLTGVCDIALGNVHGFVWLTHLVNYKSFPTSLKVVCVFESDRDLAKVREDNQDEYFYQLLSEKLSAVNIHIKTLRQQVYFDTEEACERSHSGKWNERFMSKY